MIEEFLQNKLSAILDQFIEFQKLKIETSQGMSISHSKVKPKLVEQLSQVLGMPLEHISGSIDTLSINVPWKKLFRLMESEVKIQIQGAKLRSKLRTSMSEAYVMKRRQQAVELLTSKLFNPLDTSSRNSSFINSKLKEYFLSTVLLEVKNVEIEIEIDLKHKVQLILRIQSLTLRREHKKGNQDSKISLQVQGVGLFYKATGFKEVALISPATLSFQRLKTQGGHKNRRVLTHNFNIDRIHVHLDNYNYGDIARVILLIQWHNSFIHLPYDVWKVKPSILSECKPSAKFIYCANLIKQSIADNRFKKQLALRRSYINLYSKFITKTDSFTAADQEQLLSMEKLMPLWRIAAYRSYTINVTKFKIDELRNKKESIPEKQNFVGMANMMSNFWFKRWFSNEANARQLEKQFLDKIASIQSVPDQVQSNFNVKVETITIAISIITNFGSEPFISLMGYHCQYNRESFLIEKKWHQSVQFRKCKIIFDKYLGHHENYKNMLCESKQHFGESVIPEQDCEEEDEFEDINYFLEMHFRNDSKVINIHLLPFDLYINHEIIEKLAILLNLDKLSKLSNMDKIQEAYLLHYDPWLIVEQQKENVIQLKKSLSLSLSDSLASPSKQLKKEMDNFKVMSPEKDKVQEKQADKTKTICLKSAANIIVMASSRQYPGTELILQIGSFEVQVKQQEKIILLDKITLKGKFITQNKGQQQSPYINLLNQGVSTIQIIHKFDVKIDLKRHINFDESFIDVSKVTVDLPPLNQMCTLIQLIFMYIPKHKQNRMRQYYRRKQSIGQEFMDACENLNEHINKSLVMSSDRMTNKTMLKEKRTKITSLKLQGMVIIHKYAELQIQQFCLTSRQVGYEDKLVESYNDKTIKFTVHNIKQMLKNIHGIEYQIQKELNHKGLNQDSGKKTEQKFQNIIISHMNFDLTLNMKLNKQEVLGLYAQLRDVHFEENQEASARRLQASLKISYDEVNEHKNKKSIVKIPLIQQCTIHQQQTSRFNLTDFSVQVQELAINIKPSLFKTLALVVKEMNVDDNSKYLLVNGLINSIQVKIPPTNYYIDCRHSQKCDIKTPFCQIALFKRKFELHFNKNEGGQVPKQTIQCIQLGQNNFLINRETAPNQYILQSNIRIMNHQERTLFIKLGQNEQTPGIKEGGRIRLPTLSAFDRKTNNINLTQQISMSGKDYDTYSHSERMFGSLDRHKSQNRGKSISVKPKEMLHLLVDEDEHKYLQILDQGKSFTEVSLSQLFQNTQVVVENEQSEDGQYLVVRSQISRMEGVKGSIFTFHIYCPIFISNKTPWILEYRLSAEENFIADNEEKKFWRKRSFQILPMKKVPTLHSQKIRGWCYDQVENLRLSVKKYEREFPKFCGLIQSIKRKHIEEGDGFTKKHELITLRNGKQLQIQMVLCLKFTQNILKIVIYPQYVFANLTSIFINFRVKEQNVTYHQVKLPSLRVNQKDKKIRQSQPSINAYINELTHLRTQKFKSKQVLRQLFETHDGDIEVFTGSLSKDISKRMIYYSGRQLIKKEKSFLKARGYLSDRQLSDTENYDQRKLKAESVLAENEVIKFGTEQHLIFKRVVKMEKYFTLIVLMPTVHIINKSQATFYAKSQSETLIKISKESHNYIVTCGKNVDIQACLEDEEISLSEWTKINLEDLRTIYYSKDMIQHHGSGYQSKQYTFRKKRMKKIPKIFYKVIICKYERGQKILIEESQYPPISFINNTKHRIKIEQIEQRFSEELLNKGDMGQYAPKDPYHTPEFRLSVAENYQYRQLKIFGVSEKQVFNLDFGINLSIQEYKDKVIINIKEVGDVKLTVSMAERNMLRDVKQLDQKGESLLEEVKKYTINIKSIVFAVLNTWNRELNSLVVDQFTLTKEIKNYKNYYKMQIKRIQGYDYMGLQPEFIFQLKRKEKKMFVSQLKQDNPNYFYFSMVVNEHKNALILQKCEGALAESVYYISGDLLLAYVKNYYEPCSFFASNLQYYNRSDIRDSPFMNKKFIVQSLSWQATSLSIKSRNLYIFENFLNKRYQKLIVKFLNWVGDLKPLTFENFKLNYEETTLDGLKKQINLKKKMHSFVNILMDYPLNEAKQFLLFIAGDQEKSTADKLYTLYKVIISFNYIVNWALNLNENMKLQSKTYNQIFVEENKNNTNIVDKMKNYQYCQWRYRTVYPTNKLRGKVRRLERYNTRNQVLRYHEGRARIMLALDSYIKNKLFRKIEKIYKINDDHIASIIDEWVVLYLGKSNEWIIFKPEHFLGCTLNGKVLTFSYWEEDKCEQTQKNSLNNDGRVSQVSFTNLYEGQFTEQLVEEFSAQIRRNILSCYY